MQWALSIDFGYTHLFAAGIPTIGSDDSLNTDRMVYEQKLSDKRCKNKVRDLVGDIRLDFQIVDSKDPLAIDTQRY